MSERLPSDQGQQGGNKSEWDDLAGMHPDDSTSEGEYDYPSPSEQVEELFREETEAFEATSHAAVEQQNEGESEGKYQAKHMAAGRSNSNLRRGRHFRPGASLPEDDDTQEPAEDALPSGKHFAQPAGHMRPAEVAPASPEDVKDSSEEADLGEASPVKSVDDSVAKTGVAKDSIIYSEENYTRARGRILDSINRASSGNRVDRKSLDSHQESRQNSGDDTSVADKIAEIRESMGENPSPVELTSQDERDLLITELKKSGSIEEFNQTYASKGGDRLISGDQYAQLYDEVVISTTEKNIADLEKSIQALEALAEEKRQERQAPLFKRIRNFFLKSDGPRETLTSIVGRLSIERQKLVDLQERINDEHSDYYMAKHREELETQQRVDSERRGQERLDYLTKTPVEQMAQDNGELPSEYMDALRKRGEYTLDNILLFYKGAKRDSDADAYLQEARKFINNNSKWDDEEKQKQHERVNAAITARTYGGK